MKFALPLTAVLFLILTAGCVTDGTPDPIYPALSKVVASITEQNLSTDPAGVFAEAEELLNGSRYTMVVLQTDGTMQHPHAGVNVLSDPAYAEIHAFVTEVCKNKNGTAPYSFAGVNKTAAWDTVAFGGRELRTAVVIERM